MGYLLAVRSNTSQNKKLSNFPGKTVSYLCCHSDSEVCSVAHDLNSANGYTVKIVIRWLSSQMPASCLFVWLMITQPSNKCVLDLWDSPEFLALLQNDAPHLRSFLPTLSSAYLWLQRLTQEEIGWGGYSFAACILITVIRVWSSARPWKA